MSRFLAYSLILVGLAATVVAVGSDHPRFVRGEPVVKPSFDIPDIPPGGHRIMRRLPPEPVEQADGPVSVGATPVAVD